MVDPEPNVDKSPGKLRDSHRRAALEILRSALQEGTPHRLAVSGQCMEPLVIDGDQISVTAFDAPPRLGDLVLAHTVDGEIVCHRIVHEDADGYRLAGDRTMRLDPHPRSSVLGRVKAIHRGDRTLDLRPAGPWIRLQVRLHHLVRRHRGTRWARWIEWPRRILIELGGLRWWLTRR